MHSYKILVYYPYPLLLLIPCVNYTFIIIYPINVKYVSRTVIICAYTCLILQKNLLNACMLCQLYSQDFTKVEYFSRTHSFLSVRILFNIYCQMMHLLGHSRFILLSFISTYYFVWFPNNMFR